MLIFQPSFPVSPIPSEFVSSNLYPLIQYKTRVIANALLLSGLVSMTALNSGSVVLVILAVLLSRHEPLITSAVTVMFALAFANKVTFAV